MIPKSENRFLEKIMLKQKDKRTSLAPASDPSKTKRHLTVPGFRTAFLEFLDLQFVFFGELEQALFGERIGAFCKTAAAFCLLSQEIDIHDAIGFLKS
ncbi:MULTISPECIES: hypothetical protein [unclassified Nitrobacter]|uniref:hypothetical protein n=1 Tax=unclassified Nitrobacter TaxID=2620411 RepID=UPI001AC8385C|nr:MULTISPECIES: hypothetical protein [unclassified Nitrobacter]MBN9149031.1 hypothetical protein [Nitrobacter sp.]